MKIFYVILFKVFIYFYLNFSFNFCLNFLQVLQFCWSRSGESNLRQQAFGVLLYACLLQTHPRSTGHLQRHGIRGLLPLPVPCLYAEQSGGRFGL